MNRDRRDRDLDDEIQAHLRMAARDRMERGESAEDAAFSARREFGNEALVKEVTRQMWGWSSIEHLKQDATYALRVLMRDPAFAAVSILCLALGIGATASTFSIGDALLLRPLPVSNPSEIVTLSQSTPENAAVSLSYPELLDVRRQALPDAVGFRLSMMALAGSADETPRMKMGMSVTSEFFQTLGVTPPLGRAFTSEESGVSGNGNVILLSHELWYSDFAADPAIAGRTVRLNGRLVTVVGVLPKQFSILPNMRPAYYLPYSFANRLDDRSARNLTVKARLRPGATVASAQGELAALAKVLEQQYPNSNRAHTFTLRNEFQSRVQQSPSLVIVVALLWVLAILVLTIASANIASLLLSRASHRSREMAIRLSIGAGRSRVFRQMLTESMVLSCFGAAAGIGLALASIRYLASIQIPTDTPIVIDVRLDTRVLLFTCFASVITAFAAGLAPAWRSLNITIASALKPAGMAASQQWSMLGRNTLVAGQIALSLVLLVASVALLDAFRRMVILDPGIRTSNLLMVEFDPSTIGYNQEQTRLFYRELRDRVQVLPGVRSASLSRAIPFRPNFTEEAVVPEGYQFPANQESVTISCNIVEHGYFDTLGVTLVRGEAFGADERRAVAIVNEEFARRYWPSQDPLGKRFLIRSKSMHVEVIGVARTGKYLSLVETPQPYFYLPYTQHPGARMTLLLRTDGPPATLTGGVLAAVRSLDANQPVFNVRDMETYFEQGVIGLTLSLMRVVWCMGAAGLILALIGIYGLVAYSTARRTREIGIRMAVGAGRAEVLWMVLRQGFKLAGVGTAAGLLLAVPMFAALSSAVAGVGQLSPWSIAIVCAGLLAMVAAACYLPARRAALTDPNLALRIE